MTAPARSPACPRSEAAFTIVELVIASAILIAVVGAVFAVVHPSRGLFATELERVDVQQRLRVAADTITHDLHAAGRGPSIGLRAGPLIDAVPSIRPHRIGQRHGEAGVFHPDVVSVLAVVASGAQGTLRVDDPGGRIAATERRIALDPRPHCPPDTPLCGFSPGARALLVDRHGAWDLVTVIGHDGSTLEIDYPGTLSAAYATGATIAEVSARTFHLHTDVRTSTFQLRRYDGFDSDLPLVDDVVAMSVRYFGDSEPPRVLGGGGTADRLRTTYGPPPPAATDDGSAHAWPPGESCLYRLVGEEHVPRLAPLGAGGSGLVELDPALLTDGPWCPDASSPRRADADLFRVRLIRLSLRVQAAAATFRGPAGPLFRYGGSARLSTRFVPDVEIQFDVAPRNLVSR